jgi:2-oxoglutarate ferredoxin oxidoreductase subunit alpha
MVREKCKNARFVVVVELNMGQVLRSVKAAVDDPQKVYLANRVDGQLITDRDIRNILRIIMGKGV